MSLLLIRIKPDFENVSFDVVQKQLMIETQIT